ncbi:MAG: DUF1801 domain-containing protein [Gemmatimonadaceae bacterium]
MAVRKQAARKTVKTVAKKPAKKVTTPVARKVVKANLKTVVTEASVQDFLRGLADAEQRADALALERVFAKATGKPARMWGSAIVGYGAYSYVGKSGRAGDWFLCGFSPRKGTLTLYALGSFARDAALLAKLGTHKIGGGCLYIKRLADVDPRVLQTLVKSTYARAKVLGPTMTNPRAD